MPAKDYRADLVVRLANPECAALYLKTALDEALEDGNMEAFLSALKNIVDAEGPVQEGKFTSLRACESGICVIESKSMT